MNSSIKIIDQNLITYSINEEDKTASVVGSKSYSDVIFIPHHINHDMQEYVVISISENAFVGIENMKSIQFPPDSEIRTIEKNAFGDSGIESITIPSKLVDLKDDWCS